MTRIVPIALVASLAAACAIFAPDRARVKNAVDAAQPVPDPATTRLSPEQTETAAFDGSRYKIARYEGDKMCFTVTTDNREARAKDNAFKLRLFGEPSDDAIYAADQTNAKVVREYNVKETGGVATNQYAMGPDGMYHPGIAIGQVDFPVADLDVCFDGAKLDRRVRYIVVNKVLKKDENAGSYAAWRIAR